MLRILLAELADDVKDVIIENTTEVSEELFNTLSPQPHRTKVMALAQRKPYKVNNIDPNKPIVLLEQPRDLENIGAVIRVSAAANAGAVIITGPLDIWHPAIIRGAAGLHWALPVFCYLAQSEAEPKDLLPLLNQISQQTRDTRQIISLDPTGENIKNEILPQNAILIFGTERHGISDALLKNSHKIIRLPMRNGVSSLNLATSVAATLYQL